MSRPNVFLRGGNAFFKMMLRSPLHVLFDRQFLLITVRGRKSGHAITTPVNYAREHNLLRITSLRERTWWRNLRGGGPVQVRMDGQDLQGVGTVIEDDAGVRAALGAYLKARPETAKYFDVALDADGVPRAGDVARAAQLRVVIQVQLE